MADSADARSVITAIGKVPRAQVPTLSTRLLSGFVWNLAAAVFNQGSTFAVNVIVARLLGKQVFGEYAVIQSTLLTVAGLAQLAMGYTATKYVAEFRSVDRDRAGRILWLCSVVTIVMGCLATLALLIAAPWLALHALRAQHLTTALMIGSGFLLFSVINGYQTGALVGLESYASLAKAGFVSGLTAMLGIALGSWWMGINGAVIALAATALLRCFYHSIWLRRELLRHGLALQHDGIAKEKGVILAFALPAAISGLVLMPATWLGNIILVQQPDGFAQLALFSAASTIRTLVLFLPRVINNVWFSILNNTKGKGDLEGYNTLFVMNIAVVFGVTLLAAGLLALLGREILTLFGEGFASGYQVLILLLVCTLLENLRMAVAQEIQSYAKIWASLLGTIIPWQLTFVILAYVFAPRSGAVGLATAYLIACGIFLVCTVVLTWRVRRSATAEVRSSVQQACYRED